MRKLLIIAGAVLLAVLAVILLVRPPKDISQLIDSYNSSAAVARAAERYGVRATAAWDRGDRQIRVDVKSPTPTGPDIRFDDQGGYTIGDSYDLPPEYSGFVDEFSRYTIALVRRDADADSLRVRVDRALVSSYLKWYNAQDLTYRPNAISPVQTGDGRYSFVEEYGFDDFGDSCLVTLNLLCPGGLGHAYATHYGIEDSLSALARYFRNNPAEMYAQFGRQLHRVLTAACSPINTPSGIPGSSLAAFYRSISCPAVRITLTDPADPRSAASFLLPVPTLEFLSEQTH